jgi:hypothetical protein
MLLSLLQRACQSQFQSGTLSQSAEKADIYRNIHRLGAYQSNRKKLSWKRLAMRL